MTDHFLLRIIQLKMFGFSFVFLYCLHTVITAAMLFLQFMLHLSSFVSILKNEIPEAALELC